MEGQRCPYCRTTVYGEVAGQLAACLDCRTIYHRECFRDLRDCGTLGCSGKSLRSGRVEILGPAPPRTRRLPRVVARLRRRTARLKARRRLARERGDSGRSPWFTCGVVVALLVIAVMVFGPEFLGRRHRTPVEAMAIGALKTLGSSQSLFREGDKDGDNTLDYGTLEELGQQSLIDAMLASGTKYGYTFRASYSPTTSEFLWWGTASPTPEYEDRRHFVTNHEGVTYYTYGGPIHIDPKTCEIPKYLLPIGK